MSVKYVFYNSLFKKIFKPSLVSSNCMSSDIVTHTGQKFEDDDYRLVRFINGKKLVNNNIAMDMINKIPPQSVKERVVACDGGGGPRGHPKVYINLDKPGNHTCLYCGLRFKKTECH